jgi:hypothetical protein
MNKKASNTRESNKSTEKLPPLKEERDNPIQQKESVIIKHNMNK